MLKFGSENGYFTLTTKLLIPRPITDVFPFFAEATNLERLTPSFLNFKILSPQPIQMQEGLIIDYQIKLHGLPMKWQSEITVWDPPYKFIDEQRRGPYREWIHLHAFEATPSGTEVIDFVKYRVWGGSLIERAFVRKNLTKIFSYRLHTLADIWS